ncbi:MAG: nuclear transport factor 2 family protein [Proteobacteria bacterium]|nr:nuclear transport factor 2 family protein [Pseudomonadota bacterium]
MLSREEILAVMSDWNLAWERYDLDEVMNLFHEDIVFDNWTGGQARGKSALREAWASWFANNGGFTFSHEDMFVDEAEQKVLYQWRLDWPSTEKGFEGRPESRRGVDIIHFKDGRIINKFTYAKTTVEIDGRRVRLKAGG